jgi:hypothetical protein
MPPVELEHLLRYLLHHEPKDFVGWLDMGDVRRGALEGFVDADNFEEPAEAINGLIMAVTLLAQRCAYLEQRLDELTERR